MVKVRMEQKKLNELGNLSWVQMAEGMSLKIYLMNKWSVFETASSQAWIMDTAAV